MSDIFWISKPSILITEFYSVIPTKNMTRIQQMNAITRFLMYFIILCLIFNAGNNIILILLLTIVMIICFYFIYKTDDKGISRDFLDESNYGAEKFSENKGECSFGACSKARNNVLNYPTLDIYDKNKNRVLKLKGKYPNLNVDVQSGYIDMNGNYKIGSNYSDISQENSKKNKTKSISWEKNNLYNKNNCRKPSKENPFANIVFSDYLDASNIAEPCNADDAEVEKEKQNLYNSSLFRNIEDAWERQNSQRNFYTMPIQQTPNSQTDFANWLFKTGPTCHENSAYCNYYEDPSMVSPRY